MDHHGDIAVARRQVIDNLAADLDGALVGILQARDRAQQRALAAAGLAHQDGELAGGNLQVHAAHCVHLPVVLVQGDDFQISHCSISVKAVTT
jgi:hypothetical protein